MIGRSNLSVGGGGSIVNGIIEQYLAESTTVDANTFVEFINHFYNDETLVNVAGSARSINAVKLDTNKVFITHTNNITDKFISGIVCTISENTITTGTSTVLVNSTDTGLAISTTLIDTDKVFITYSSTGTAAGYLKGIVCTISGTTITAGTATTLISTSYTGGNYPRVTQIDTNKVFIAHPKGGSTSSSRYCLNGIVCTISGTTITVGTDTTLISVSNTAQDLSNILLIDTNKVFMVHQSTSSPSDYLNGVVCTISGTTITAGTDTNLDSVSGRARYSSIVLLENNKVFIAYGNIELCGRVCEIAGTTITPGTVAYLASDDNYTADGVSATLIGTNKVFIAHSSGSSSTNKYLNGIVCNVSNTTITKGTDTTLDSTAYSYGQASTVLIDTNTVFIAHAGDNINYYLNGLICSVNGTEISTVYKAPTIKASETKIQGLTKTQGTTTTQADVWVLNNQ